MSDSSRPACLWCGAKTYKASKEHVFPDALGCDDGYALDAGVCQACNNRFGRLDHALVVQFEMAAFLAGVRKKGGRKPSVDGWASFAARHGPDGPEMHFNAGPGDQDFGSRRLKPASAAHGVFNPRFEIDGEEATASFSTEIGRDPMFVPALFKVAINVVAKQEGLASAAAVELAAARQFVMTREGDFATLIVEFEEGEQLIPFRASIWRAPDRPAPAVALTFFGATFVVDLGDDQAMVKELEQRLQAQGPSGWTRLAAKPAKRRRARAS